MRGGVSSWICLASLAAGGCATTTQTADVKIRAIPDAAAKLRPGSGLLADAAGQLALGNVGLALEGFRKALREQPNSPEAYAGIAKCYEAMGRYDLARNNYEAALALTPQSPQLLTAVAVALDQQGDAQAAAVARNDAAAAQPPHEVQLPQPRIGSTAPVALTSSITVQLPPARSADGLGAMAANMRVELPAPGPVAEDRRPVMPEPVLPLPRTNQPARVALGPGEAVQSPGNWSAELARTLGAYVSLQPSTAATDQALPQPKIDQPAPLRLSSSRGVHSLASSAGVLRALAASFGLDLQSDVERQSGRALAKPAQPTAGPYLERLSPGEVALVTSGRPAWRAQLVAQTRVSTTVRWVPIMMAEARPNIRILNAAQRQGLAAQTRSVLLDRGWRRIEVATALDLRDRSVVLYPASRRTLGRILAAQFGFPAQLRNDGVVLTVLLGRDALRPVASAKRG